MKALARPMSFDALFAVVLGAMIVAGLACDNRSRLNADPTEAGSPTPNASGWATATPDPYKTVDVWGTTPQEGCTGSAGGNADYSKPFVDDPDDPHYMADAVECLWLCAIDPDPLLGMTSPSELDEVWDFDGTTPTEYVHGHMGGAYFPTMVAYPIPTTCNSWHPAAPPAPAWP